MFFRWIKQTLKIKHFLGSSENAVRIQIAVALIAFMVLHLAWKTQKSTLVALNFTRVVRLNLMQRRRFDKLHPSALEPPTLPNQIEFKWGPS